MYMTSEVSVVLGILEPSALLHFAVSWLFNRVFLSLYPNLNMSVVLQSDYSATRSGADSYNRFIK